MNDAAPGSGESSILYLDLIAHPVNAEAAERAEPAVARPNLRIFPLEDVGRNPETIRRLYELVREGVIDDPSNDGTFMEREQFASELFEPYYWRWAGSTFLAADGGTWVGLVNLQIRGAVHAEFGVTVVRRADRRRGIARALKLRALHRARELGAVHITTRNHPDNPAIVRLNEELGFQKRPG